MGLNIRHNILAAPAAPPPTAGLSVPPPTAGVLTGVARTTYTGGMTVGAGTVIQNKNINVSPGDAIHCNGANIHLINCMIQSNDFYGIDADFTASNGLVVDHCTVIGPVAGQGGILATALNWTITNCDISRWDNGILFNGGGLCEGNYIHTLGFLGLWTNGTAYLAAQRVTDPAVSGSFWKCLVSHTSAATGSFAQDRASHPTFWLQEDPHVDGMQTSGLVNNLTIRGNWIESLDTSCILLQAEPGAGAISNVLIEGNTFMAPVGISAYSACIYSNARSFPVSAITVRNNRMQIGWNGDYIIHSGGTAIPITSGNVDYFTGNPINP